MQFKLYFDDSKDRNVLFALVEPPQESIFSFCQSLKIPMDESDTRSLKDRLLYIGKHELGLNSLNHLICSNATVAELIHLADSLQFKEIVIIPLGFLSSYGQVGFDLIKALRENSKNHPVGLVDLRLSDFSDFLSHPIYTHIQDYLALPEEKQQALGARLINGFVVNKKNISEQIISEEKYFFSIIEKRFLEKLLYTPTGKKNDLDSFNFWFDNWNKKQEQIFFFNTEALSDKKYINSYFKFREKIQHIYIPASGLKILQTIDECSLDPNESTITIFDYNSQLIYFKRALFMLWDGVDYPAFINNFCDQNSIALTDLDRDTHETLWKKTLDHFGGEEDFAKRWRHLLKFKHKLICTDIVNQPNHFAKLVEDRPNSVVFISNIYDYQETLLRGSLENMDSFIQLIRGLQSKRHNPFIIGSNCFGGGDAFFAKSYRDIMPQLTDPFV